MTRNLIILFLFICFNMNATFSQTIKVMTYNIRYATVKDGENQWDLRKDFLARQIMFHSPDVFGIQEGLHHQVNYLDSILIDFQFVGTGRDDGKEGGEFSALYYNTEKFKLVNSGQFWLSDTPDVPSVGWDAALNRICTFAILMEKSTQKNVLVLNTHFDHVGEQARIESAKLILEKINALNSDQFPVILMGDLNLEPESDGIGVLNKGLKDTYLHSIAPPFGPKGTFNNFDFCEPVTRRIDYIFVNSKFEIEKYATLSDSYDLKYPSDHLPVFTQLKMK